MFHGCAVYWLFTVLSSRCGKFLRQCSPKVVEFAVAATISAWPGSASPPIGLRTGVVIRLAGRIRPVAIRSARLVHLLANPAAAAFSICARI